MRDYGYWAVDSTAYIPWNTNDSSGAAVTRATDGSIRIYKDGNVAQRTSASGITDTEDFDSITGCHSLTIDLSDNTHASFYADGSTYWIMLQGATIDGQTVNSWIGFFRIGLQAASALTAIGLDHLLSAAVVGADVTDNSIVAKLVSKSATADWDDFVNTTDSLQAIRDNMAQMLVDVGLNDVAATIWNALSSAYTITGSFGAFLDGQVSIAGTGGGDTAVDQDTNHSLGANGLQYLTSGALGIDGATIRFYLKTEYDAGTYTIRAETTTDSAGDFVNAVYLNSGLTYTAVYEKNGEYGPDTKEFTVS